ncbi:helix-hairpin-helix domain-containing protein [Thiomonas sp.]|uniref:helix-hairpin-helix domain-containing protein n=1 Tax=Thiomonas sp. TaxID=2047785 RepID=UPI00261F40E4|nr:helix-hairpin-helix domain-containing protein [Thiomonas sp.]
MGYSAAEKQQMLALKGVGETVVARLEQIGFPSLAQLAGEDPADLTWQIAQMLGSTCWHNSPRARGAIRAIIGLAPRRAR